MSSIDEKKAKAIADSIENNGSNKPLYIMVGLTTVYPSQTQQFDTKV